MSNQYIFYWQRRSFELILCSSQKKTTIECGPNKMIQSSFLFAKVETSKKSMVSGFLSPISSDSQFLRTVKKSQFLQTVKKQSMAFSLRNISSIVYLGPVSPPSWLYFSDLFTVFFIDFHFKQYLYVFLDFCCVSFLWETWPVFQRSSIHPTIQWKKTQGRVQEFLRIPPPMRREGRIR